MNKEGRNLRLDFIKAVAIILVVVGHAIQFCCGSEYTTSGDFFDNPVFKIIYSFHMPLFMCVSGWLFARSVARYELRSLAGNKAVALLLPIVVWGTIDYLQLVITGHATLGVAAWWSVWTGELWFLWALVYNITIVLAVHRLFKDSLVVYALIYVALFFVPRYELYIFMYPYFVGMYLLAKHNFDFAPLRTTGAMVVTAACYVALLALYRRSSYIYVSGYYIFEGGGIKPISGSY